MKKNITLVIMAAGMGSRFGGLKQIEPMGPSNEFIIDYSIYDAIKAGFNKVVFIIKEENFTVFKETIGKRVEPHINVEYVFQKNDNIPDEYQEIKNREKPLGTAQAILCCKEKVHEPFAIINADDFYGRDAYKVVFDYLTNEISDDHYAMVGFQCLNTLTANGTVTRGLCEEKDGNLSHIVEIQKIALKDNHAVYEENGEWKPIDDHALVSMNFWGFTPKIFDELEPIFKNFLEKNLEANPMKCEHVIPTAVGELVSEGKITVKMLSSKDKWFGVTYKEDKPDVVQKIAEKKASGEYPDVLWK